MEKEFIPYISALALKELGFDEPCFGTWRKGAVNGSPFEYNIDYHTKVEMDHKLCPKNSDYVNDWISAILYQQAFSFLVKLQDEFKVSFDNEGWYIYNLENEMFLGDDALDVLINTVRLTK